MGETLKKRLRQSKFESPYQEAILAVLVAASTLNEQLDRACSEFDISRQQYNILRILKGARGGGYQCGDIASRMLDRAPDITRRIDGLAKLGLVERERSEDDRRVVITQITPKGLDLLDKLQVTLNVWYNDLRKKLSTQECRALAELCEKLIDSEE
ncbi:MAG TPA: MarR family transcriptional regulator [Candidatus Kapabacteria bacterium]|nr:MarR family transcriptional regulator [Candidatus Kapabacteria bacterium]